MTRLLTQRDVARLLDARLAIQTVHKAFVAMARGKTVMPSKIYLPLPGGNDFRAMPAFIRTSSACGVKWVNVHPKNPRRGLPTVMALIVINDPATGVPLAVMDGLLITKLRTAAAGAVAARALARAESRVVGLVGCGAQADAQIVALANVLTLAQVRVWGHFSDEARRFCRRMARQLPRVRFQPVSTVEQCVSLADVVVTVTPSHRPIVKRAWIAPGTHINAIGADAPGKQELDLRILQQALVVVDDREQAVHGGEINVPVSRGQFHPRQIHARLGDVLIGRQRGRRTDQEITVFDSTGLAIHDIALGFAALRKAECLHLGQRIAWFEAPRA